MWISYFCFAVKGVSELHPYEDCELKYWKKRLGSFWGKEHCDNMLLQSQRMQRGNKRHEECNIMSMKWQIAWYDCLSQSVCECDSVKKKKLALCWFEMESLICSTLCLTDRMCAWIAGCVICNVKCESHTVKIHYSCGISGQHSSRANRHIHLCSGERHRKRNG